MRITDISIENFRSIAGDSFDFSFDDYCVIVGPNNSGKSNVLRALNLFFNDQVDGAPYDSKIDFPMSTIVTPQSKTKITVTLTFKSRTDSSLEKAISRLETESGQRRLQANQVRLRLEYTKRNARQWRFISRAGLRSIKSELVQAVVDAVRSSIRFKYLPVGRDILGTIRDELSEELIRTIFSGWSGAVAARKEINDAISDLISKLQPRLENSGQEITNTMTTVFEDLRKLELRLPFDNLENLLPYLIPTLQDNYETALNQKGAGLQTSTLLFLLKYLADHHPQRHNSRVTYIWAIEEPESYLHPSKQKSMANLLMNFSKEVQTIVTTHSPHFVPRMSEISVLVVDKAQERPFSTCIVSQEYELARQALGVSLLDSMYLYPHNIVVEGPSDELLLGGAWRSLYLEGLVATNPDHVRFFPGKNASGACTLYESMLVFGDSGEVDLRLLVDGDDAGQKALRGLLNRLGPDRKIKANFDYFSLVTDIEWLTSYRVMISMSKRFPASVDMILNTKQEITSFRIRDTMKMRVAAAILEESKIEDLGEFADLINNIEASFPN